MDHQLLTEGIEAEADAKCSAGDWRLLRMATTLRPDAVAQRQKEIQDVFQQHLDLIRLNSSKTE